ncbi:hypothetical protein BBJ28_00007770 [Nothophytophthora sp. Chile5]|nr:hypothetical protein BBJ28_00007770 [Nothophytophthora sp. Chile5]
METSQRMQQRMQEPPPAPARDAKSPVIPTLQQNRVARLWSPFPREPLTPRALEYLDGEDGETSAEVEAEEEELPWSTILPKFSSRSWQTRKEGFELAQALFERPGMTPGRVQPALAFVDQMCEDDHASALQAGISAVLAYVKNVEPVQKSIVPGVVQRIAANGFSGRSGIVTLCKELVDAFVASGAGKATVGTLLKAARSRNRKVPLVCLFCILDVLKKYGSKVVPVKKIGAALPKLFDSAGKGTRHLAMDIAVELQRWEGPACVQSIVTNLRRPLQIEFKKRTKDMEVGSTSPSKFVRETQGVEAERSPVTSSGASSDGSSPASASSIVRSSGSSAVSETSDLPSKLPDSEPKATWPLPRWSEKIEAFRDVLELIDPVPYGDGYADHDVVLKGLIDSDVNVVVKALQVLGDFAEKLREKFTPFARLIAPDLFLKLSTRSSLVLEATQATLDLILQHSLPLMLMLDGIRGALDSSATENPLARVRAVKFLARLVKQRSMDLKDSTQIETVAELVMTSMDNDADLSVRNVAGKTFSLLLNSTDQPIGWWKEKLNEASLRNTAISQRRFAAIWQRPEDVASPGSSSRSASDREEQQRSVERLDLEGDDLATGRRSPVPVTPTRDLTSSPEVELASTEAVTSNVKVGAEFASIAISVSSEEAEDVIAGLEMEGYRDIRKGFGSRKWLERKAAIERLETYIREHPELMSERVIESWSLVLSKHVKEFKDSNLAVVKSAFKVVETFAEHAVDVFPHSVVCLVMPRAAKELGNAKATETIRYLIFALCQATSPSYTIGCLIRQLEGTTATLAHVEAHKLLYDCVMDFDIAIWKAKALVEFAKGPAGLASSNVAACEVATVLLGAMYSRLGPDLLPLLELESMELSLVAALKPAFERMGCVAMEVVKVNDVEDEDEAKSDSDPAGIAVQTSTDRSTVSGAACSEVADSTGSGVAGVGRRKRKPVAMRALESLLQEAGEIPYTSPVDPESYGNLTVAFLLAGLSFLAMFFTRGVAQKKNVLVELVLALIAAFFLGFGSLFLFLWAEIYV